MKSFLTKIVTLTFTLLLVGTIAFAEDMKLPAKPSLPAAQTAVGAVKTKAGLIDINTASVAELKAIPGMGDVYAKKIVAGRPYAKKDQLKSKKIIPASLYDKIKNKIVAKQPTK
jgi:competence protein ComEA